MIMLWLCCKAFFRAFPSATAVQSIFWPELPSEPTLHRPSEPTLHSQHSFALGFITVARRGTCCILCTLGVIGHRCHPFTLAISLSCMKHSPNLSATTLSLFFFIERERDKKQRPVQSLLEGKSGLRVQQVVELHQVLCELAHSPVFQGSSTTINFKKESIKTK